MSKSVGARKHLYRVKEMGIGLAVMEALTSWTKRGWFSCDESTHHQEN